MGRSQLIDEVREILAKTGFYLSEKHDRRGLSFDVVARRDDLLLLLKILQNVDAFGKANAEELRLVATTLGGSPKASPRGSWQSTGAPPRSPFRRRPRSGGFSGGAGGRHDARRRRS